MVLLDGLKGLPVYDESDKELTYPVKWFPKRSFPCLLVVVVMTLTPRLQLLSLAFRVELHRSLMLSPFILMNRNGLNCSLRHVSLVWPPLILLLVMAK